MFVLWGKRMVVVTVMLLWPSLSSSRPGGCKLQHTLMSLTVKGRNGNSDKSRVFEILLTTLSRNIEQRKFPV